MGERAFEEVRRFLAVGPRDAGTPGAEKAAQYLLERLQALGVEAQIESFDDMTPRGTATFRNVVGRVPGRGEGFVILAGHYDTQGGLGEGFEGANDSGSSTGVLLHLAELLAAAGPRPFEVRVVFFDGEEAMVRYGPQDGLHGSRHMAQALRATGEAEAVRAVVVLDMIGDRDLNVTIPRNGTSGLMAAFFEAARAEGVRPLFSLYPHAIGDDHDPFLNHGMPAIDLIDFFYGRAPGRNDYWHTAEDRLDKLSPESLSVIGRVVLRFLQQQADAP